MSMTTAPEDRARLLTQLSAILRMMALERKRSARMLHHMAEACELAAVESSMSLNLSAMA